jgi:hypothetical protein
MKSMKALAALALIALMSLIAPVHAQIQVLNPFNGSNVIHPFAAPQGSALVTSAASSYACAAPTPLSTGYVARTGYVWNGQKWGMNNGLTWNRNTPYALCMGTGSDYLRFELHDTPFDHGQNDPSTKRRDEIGSASTFRNGVDSWLGYSFRTQVTNLRQGFSVRLMQVHWPSGASPAVGHSLKYANGGLAMVVSTKNDSTDNVQRGTPVPIAQGQVYDVVVHFKLGTFDSFEDTYVNGKLVSHPADGDEQPGRACLRANGLLGAAAKPTATEG